MLECCDIILIPNAMVNNKVICEEFEWAVDGRGEVIHEEEDENWA